MTCRFLNVGVCQFGATPDKEKNLCKIRKFIENARTAEVVVFPEYSMFYSSNMFRDVTLLRKVAEPLDGKFVLQLSTLAREYSTHIVCGLIEQEKGNIYNTVVVISDRGELVTFYRKSHLFDAYGYQESKVFSSGFCEPTVFNIGSARCSVVVCFELRFPELFRVAALKGSEIMFVPAAWFRGDLKEDLLHVLARARAHENGMFVIVCNQYSESFCGRSCIVDPWGVVLLDLGAGEKYVEIRIDVDEVAKARETVPVLRLRRKLLYTKIISL